MTDITIPTYYNSGEVAYLHDRVSNAYVEHHASRFQIRNNVDLSEPIKLASELPIGAFIAGGFMRQILDQTGIKDYDLFFDGEQSVKRFVKRVQGAPEGSFLHGYSAQGSLREFAEGFTEAMTLTHASKPTIQLHRVKWCPTPKDAIDKFDFSVCQFALDRNLMVTYERRGIDDARSKRLRMMPYGGNIFAVSLGLRIKRYEAQGYKWMTDYFDSAHRESFLKKADEWVAKQVKKAEKLGIPTPTIDNPSFGSFQY